MHSYIQDIYQENESAIPQKTAWSLSESVISVKLIITLYFFVQLSFYPPDSDLLQAIHQPLSTTSTAD